MTKPSKLAQELLRRLPKEAECVIHGKDLKSDCLSCCLCEGANDRLAQVKEILSKLVEEGRITINEVGK